MGSRAIVVVEAGWVFLAEAVTPEVAYGVLPALTLKSASVIRVWGTSAGLGQIALKGVTKDTILDFTGTITVPHSKVIAIIPCTY